MKQKCEYCDSYIDDTQENCPNCGAVNPQYKRSSEGTPRTIEQLQQWYTSHHLPDPEVTRFFIGVDYRKPKAFGIYRDGDRVIVYKNKADGSRAIRYSGSDEAYAVNEIYTKLKETISSQKAAHVQAKAPVKRRTPFWEKPAVWITALLCVLALYIADDGHNRGYYSYNNSSYYYLDSWYMYDTVYDTWLPITADSELDSNSGSYFISSDYSSSYGTTDFSDTDYYASWEASSDSWLDNFDWDSDYDWGDDDWDSDYGDWDSDW